MDYLSNLQNRTKWKSPNHNIKVGEIVIIKEDNIPPATWPLGKVIETHPGKLTDSIIDRLQNYYGIDVRSNVGNLSGLQKNVIAALFHCSSSVEKPMHGQCPIGKDSWCYYQRALSCGKKPKEKYKGLANEVLNMIKPTYLELCTKELLTKCLHGKTQNSNECLNGVIWQRVPMEVFVCLKTLKSGGCCDPI
ncbi:uncharacterized protein TNCV_1283781 [Trichonephila clavipes]|uniref:DUF5641 domain-containing protein n=1 Tax=Trichonephila clavipes TaxID=2585209 RepID=A0A8X6SQE8_TRICX|nr:uncharacterized protein TNCV_1283781 [Trichonephila clavipes]